MLAIQMGVARGIFSNEAGLGSAPIAHAAAETDNPVRQGSVAMLGTFIDTIIVCTITGLVIVTSGQWKVESPDYTACVERGGTIQQEVSIAWGIERPKTLCVEADATVNKVQTGASLTTAAFETGLPTFGHYIVALGLVLFAFTTVLGWSVYGERCVEYLFGVGAILPFRILWVLAIPVGATIKLSFAWLVADTLNALMAIPNLLALLLLSPVVFRITKEYFEQQRG
jgi:AGCS family alanine or glycine:cation symporter